MEHLGHVVFPAPVLGIADRLEAGRTYLVVPADHLPCGGTGRVVTAASFAALLRGRTTGGRNCPFEYAKDDDGRTVLRRQHRGGWGSTPSVAPSPSMQAP